MKVYIIYAREDTYLIPMITDRLLQEGIGVWIDAPGFPGETLQDQMRRWMDDSDLIVAIWSAASVKSKFCQLGWEIALDIKKRIIIVKVGEVNLPTIPDFCPVLSCDNTNKVPLELAQFIKASSRYSLFISYSRKDKSEVERLLDLVRRSTHGIWIDKSGIDPGEAFPQEILQAIDRADYFLLLWSQNSRRSRWVEREWNYAYKTSKRIIPILLDKTPLPMVLEDINAFTSLEDEKLFEFLGIPHSGG